MSHTIGRFNVAVTYTPPNADPDAKSWDAFDHNGKQSRSIEIDLSDDPGKLLAAFLDSLARMTVTLAGDCYRTARSTYSGPVDDPVNDD